MINSLTAMTLFAELTLHRLPRGKKRNLSYRPLTGIKTSDLSTKVMGGKSIHVRVYRHGLGLGFR